MRGKLLFTWHRAAALPLLSNCAKYFIPTSPWKQAKTFPKEYSISKHQLRPAYIEMFFAAKCDMYWIYSFNRSKDFRMKLFLVLIIFKFMYVLNFYSFLYRAIFVCVYNFKVSWLLDLYENNLLLSIGLK